MKLLVTTAVRAGAREWDRAAVVAERCGGERVKRRGPLAPLLASSKVYVVGQHREELRAGDQRLAVHEGMLRIRLHGGDHPLIRAVAPHGRARHLVDGTLGLAGDALHLAAALGCTVTGVEISPVIFSLLEEGLPRLATDKREVVATAAARVRPILGDCVQVLGGMDPDSADAVLLAPMYAQPDRAAPGFELLRGEADHGGLQAEQLRAGLRVAPRVVVKWPRGTERPAALPPRATPVTGHRVEYWVIERSRAE